MRALWHAAVGIGLIAGASTSCSFCAFAQAPTQLTPPAPQEKKAAPKPVPKPPRKPPVQPAPNAAVAPTPTPAHDADMAYGAYQRGFYMTAFAIATRRVEQKSDVKAMTLLGELYARGYGIARDDAKAAEWYRLAAERGDREAMFALAMFHLGSRIANASSQEGTRLLAAAAKLGHAAAAYDLALLYMEGRLFPQDFTRAAELFRSAADLGNPEAQYALATLYKEGRGVPKDLAEAARLLQAAALADNVDAQVEYAIALFNGLGVQRNEPVAATLLRKAARKGNPVAQNRLANVLAVGRGVSADTVEAIKWHLIAKAGGVSDIPLDTFAAKQTAEVRAAAEKAAKSWIDAIKQAREQHS